MIRFLLIALTTVFAISFVQAQESKVEKKPQMVAEKKDGTGQKSDEECAKIATDGDDKSESSATTVPVTGDNKAAGEKVVEESKTAPAKKE